MLGEVAPGVVEIPALILWAAALIVFIGYLVARGTLAAYEHTVHRALDWIANQLPSIGWPVNFDFGSPVRSIDRTFYRWLSSWAKHMDAGVGALLHYASQVQDWTANEIVGISEDLLHFGNWLVWRHLPNLLKSIIKWSLPPYAIAKLIQAIEHANLPRVFRMTKTIATTVERTIVKEIALPFRGEWDWIHRHWRALVKILAYSGAIGGAVALPWISVFPRVKLLERWEGFTRRRLRRLEALLGAAGIAAVMANALGLPNWRCITRGNLGKASRGICGMNPSFLQDLLGLLADFVVLENICAVIPWLESAFSTVASPLIGILAKAGAGICDASYNPGPPLPAQRLYLPSTVSTAIYTGL
jgi:hypothetical protein